MISQENYLLVILGIEISFSFWINISLKRPLWPLLHLVSVTVFYFSAQDLLLLDKYLLIYLSHMCVPLLEHKLLRGQKLFCMAYRRQYLLN